MFEMRWPSSSQTYENYYNETRTHLSLSKDAPLRRAVGRLAASQPADLGRAASSIWPGMIPNRDKRSLD